MAKNHLYITDGINTLLFNSLAYDMANNIAYDISEDWVDLLQDFCSLSDTFDALMLEYPSLNDDHRIYTNELVFVHAAGSNEQDDEAASLALEQMDEEEISELFRDEPDQFWDQKEAADEKQHNSSGSD